MHKESENGHVETHVSDIEAKGGSRTAVTRNILIVSLTLVIILLLLTLGLGFFKNDQTGADKVNSGNVAATASR